MRRLWLGLAGAAWLTAAGPTIVIQNATVLTVTKGSFRGSVVIRDGKIAEAGERVLVPPGAQVVDAAGRYLMPGIIDCHSHIASDSVNEGSISVSSMVAIEDVLNPEDIAIYRALAGGVTTAFINHGSANAIGGQCTVIKTRWGKDARGLPLEGARPGLKLALGENPKRAGSTAAQRYPATRMGVEDVIRQAFAEAKAYRQARLDYQARILRGETALPPRKDLRLEPLVEVLDGARLAHVHCYRADEILMVLRLADEIGFKIKTLIHALEGYKVAREILAHGAAPTTFSDWWAYKMEAWDAIPYNAALMVRKGLLVSLNSDDAELMRHLNQEAAKAVKYGGLSEDEALALITINPARQLDIDRRVGSIEPGKDADLVIYDRHPLSNYAKVQTVFIDGEMYFDREKDIAGRAEKQARRKALADQAKQEQEKKAAEAARKPQ